MTTHSSVLAWRIPGMEEPNGLPSVGLHRVGHDWSDLAVAAAAILDDLSFLTSIWNVPDFLSYLKKKIWQEKQEKSILPRCSHAPKRLMMFGWCPSLQRTSSSPAKSLWSSLEAYSGKKVKSRDPFLWCLIRNNCTPWSPSPSTTLSCHWVWKTLAKSKRWFYHRGLAVHILGQCFLWLGAVLWQGGCLAAPLTWPTSYQ